MSTVVQVECIDQTLKITNSPTITSGDIQSDIVRFNFCNLWNQFTKRTVIFYRDERKSYKVLLNWNNECVIPKEVLSEEGCFYFGVFGTYNNTVKTSEVLKYRVRKGIITESTDVPDPTPDIYQQILSDLTNIQNVSDNTNKTVEDFIAESNKTLADTRTATERCYNAINNLNIGYGSEDIDGRYPQTTDDETDYDGGYPVDNEGEV